MDIDDCLLFQFFLALLVSPHRPLGSRWRLVFYCKVKVLWLRIWFSSIERVKLHNLAVELSHHLLNCGFLLFILHFALIDQILILLFGIHELLLCRIHSVHLLFLWASRLAIVFLIAEHIVVIFHTSHRRVISLSQVQTIPTQRLVERLFVL